MAEEIAGLSPAVIVESGIPRVTYCDPEIASVGLTEAKAREVPRWRESAAFTPLERRVMEYAEAMCQTPVAVTDELSAALLAELGPAALVELNARVGLLNATARGNVALGIRSEHFADACGLPPLAQPSARSSARSSARPSGLRAS